MHACSVLLCVAADTQAEQRGCPARVSWISAYPQLPFASEDENLLLIIMQFD